MEVILDHLGGFGCRFLFRDTLKNLKPVLIIVTVPIIETSEYGKRPTLKKRSFQNRFIL